MKKHEILSPQARALFNPPSDPAAIVRHYTFSPEDLALIRRRRRDANRLGFAVHLAYQRFPGRVLGIEEIPSAGVLSFIAGQLSIESESFNEYARREETRWEHFGDIQSYLRVRPFSRDDHRLVARIATTEAIGTD
jgi:TnpA family transposase